MSLHYVRVMSCECIVHIKYYLVFIPYIYSQPYNITYEFQALRIKEIDRRTKVQRNRRTQSR